MRIGVINWDCSLPPETYFGYYQTRNLSPAKYRPVTPYYADVCGTDAVSYHRRTQEEYDRELSYAVRAGIDYFAYVWYPDEGSRTHVTTSPTDCSAHVFELNYARRLHEHSVLRDKIGLCAIAGAHPFSDGDVDALVRAMQAPYYETIDGRPLLYVYNGSRTDFIERVRAACAKRGTPDPYVVAMYHSIHGGEDLDASDALSAYAAVKSGVTTYSELFAECLRANETRRATGKPVIPLFTTGWDPSPRVDQPSPWVTYPDKDYAAFASAEELMTGARGLVDWIRTACGAQFAGHILTFAWNEFEEGGIICPTVGADGNPDTARLDAFGAVGRYWREVLV
ncbi:MAG: hypothetical protein IJ449_01745 [Clostridia bacterium]|nr:hypothetical protein [Clostridia bacterium]